MTLNSTINLSEEQQLFISTALEGKNILVDACIGSGKTTAIQQLCNILPSDKKILYLTYNKLLKIDAEKRGNRYFISKDSIDRYIENQIFCKSMFMLLLIMIAIFLIIFIGVSI